MQCLRRYFEEGHDRNHLANAGKYGSALMVAFFRVMYNEHPTHTWLTFVIIFSFTATVYQLYWDFVKDWGFCDRESKNYMLRDDLVLKHKFIYYVSMVIIQKEFSFVQEKINSNDSLSSGTKNYKAFIFISIKIHRKSNSCQVQILSWKLVVFNFTVKNHQFLGICSIIYMISPCYVGARI